MSSSNERHNPIGADTEMVRLELSPEVAQYLSGMIMPKIRELTYTEVRESRNPLYEIGVLPGLREEVIKPIAEYERIHEIHDPVLHPGYLLTMGIPELIPKDEWSAAVHGNGLDVVAYFLNKLLSDDKQ